MAGVLRRRGDTKEKVMGRWRQKLEWWVYKPKNTKNFQQLLEARKRQRTVSPLPTTRVQTPRL